MSSINDGIGDPRNHEIQGRAKKVAAGTRDRARRMLRTLAVDEADEGYLLDVLGLDLQDDEFEESVA